MAKQVTKKKATVIDQTFSFNAPGATRVALVGDFTHWQKNPVNLQKQPDGIWRTTVALEPGEHHYRFLVDGEWRDDPECPLRVANPFGGHDAVLKLPPTQAR